MVAAKVTNSFLVLFLSFVALFAHTGSAIFQDEAYNIDFAHTLVGTPTRRNTFFHRPNAGSKASLLYTLSNEGVIGAVNPRDGEVVWRVLANNTLGLQAPVYTEGQADAHGQGEAYGILRTHESSSTIVSAIGKTAKAWDAKDGRLIWEWSAEWPIKSLEVLGLEGAKGDVAVLTEGEFSGGDWWLLSGADGKLKWTGKLDVPEYPLGISQSASSLFCTVLRNNRRGGYNIKTHTLDVATGKEISTNILETGEDVASEESIIHLSGTSVAPIVVWKDEKVKNIKFNLLGTKQKSISMLDPYGTSKIRDFSINEPTAVDAKPHFLIQYDQDDGHRGEIWHVDDVKVGKMNRAFTLEQMAGPGSFSVATSDKDVFFTRHTASENILYASTSAEALEKWSLTGAAGSQHSNHEAVFAVSELARSGSQFAVRNAFVTTDGDWVLAQNGVHTWIRYESLAGISAAAFVDIPAKESLVDAIAAETSSNPVSAYIQRVQRHVADLQHFPAWLISVPTRLLSSFTGLGAGESGELLTNDGFGFNKILVVTTKRGRVAALNAAVQGQVVWSRQIAHPDAGETWPVRSIEVNPNGVHIIAEFGEVLTIDPVSGKTVQHKPWRPAAGVLYHAGFTTATGKRSLVPIDLDNVPGQLPEDLPENAVIVTKRAKDVVGWKATGDGKTTLAWSFIPRQGEAIESVTSRPAHDPVASIGRALGDRNVLYKYLSNNLLLVTATSIAASTLSVYLLDSVTGQTLYSTTHHNVNAAVQAPVVFSENWFAYSLFSAVPGSTPAGSASPASSVQGHQLVISEIFESQFANDRGPMAQALNYSSLSDPYLPDVKSAAYVVTSPITTLATTSTLQGITPRSLLAYTPALAALLAIPVPFLSPRRPVDREPTAAEREEGLMKYQAHLDYAPTWFLSHKREILGIDKVVSTPTQMESTSLVFAYGGLDLFGTRVSPIGTFDVLGKGFGKIQLVLTCVALAIGTGLLSPMARRKQIDSLWRS